MKHYIFYVFSFSTLLQGSHAYFQTKILKQDMYLSVASKALLKTMIIQLQAFQDDQLINVIANDQNLLKTGRITSKQLNEILTYIRSIKQKTLQPGQVWGCKGLSRGWQDLWMKIRQGLTGVKLLNHRAELQEIKSEFVQLEHSIKSEPIQTDKILKIVTTLINVCSDLMHHVDGYFVGEYDFLFLYHVIIVLKLLQCRV